MQLDGDPIQSISTYYFETKERDKDNYKSIVRIFVASIFFPVVTFIAFSYLAFFYSPWIKTYAIKYMKGEGENISDDTSQKDLMIEKQSKGTLTRIKDYVEKTANYKKQNTEEKGIVIFALGLVFVLLTFTLIVFHIIASIHFINYGNEVLYDDNDNHGSMDTSPGGIGNDGHSYNLGNDDQCVPIVYVATSFIPTVLLISFLVLKSSEVYFIWYVDADESDESFGMFLQLSLGTFLVYLGFYFLPYMLLAFINDPIQTAFIYMMGASFILCVYLLTYSVCSFVATFFKKKTPKVMFIHLCGYKCAYFFYLLFTLTGGFSIAYSLTILILILTLGNFHDFEAVENLTLPIIIGLLSIFVLKPSSNYVQEAVKSDLTGATKTTNIELKEVKCLDENDNMNKVTNI